MLHDRHELNGVVIQIGNPRQDIAREFIECSDFRFFLRHADMGFINTQAAFFRRCPGVLKAVRLRRIPILPDKISGMFHLHHPPDISGNAIHSPGCGIHLYFNFAAMSQSCLTRL